MSSFQPLGVVGRGSETQLQVGEKLIKLTEQDKGNIWSAAVLQGLKGLTE